MLLVLGGRTTLSKPSRVVPREHAARRRMVLEVGPRRDVVNVLSERGLVALGLKEHAA
jgi:hypothetical protein